MLIWRFANLSDTCTVRTRASRGIRVRVRVAALPFTNAVISSDFTLVDFLSNFRICLTICHAANLITWTFLLTPAIADIVHSPPAPSVMVLNTRKPHRKTRTGCKQCKRRKVKVSASSTLLCPELGAFAMIVEQGQALCTRDRDSGNLMCTALPSCREALLSL